MSKQTEYNIDIEDKHLYTLYDSKSETWSAPFVHSSRGDAIRAFSDAVNKENEQSLLYTHPEDFTLFHIGYWNDKTATITPIDKVAVGTGLDFKLS